MSDNTKYRTPLRSYLLLGSVLLAACSQSLQQGSSDAPLQPRIEPENWPMQASPIARSAVIERKVSALLSQMSTEQKVGQIIQADIASVTPQQVRQYYLGSVLNGGNSAPGRDNRVGAAAWLELADAFWQASTDTSDGRPYIPVFWGTDAVHGHSNVKGATIFPHNIGLGAMHEPQLLQAIGRATAVEMQVTGLDWTFAPTIAVARDDRWGRTYESYSEDPALVASYAPYILQGIQGKVGAEDFLRGEHMLATVKHFLGDGGTVAGKDQGDNISSEAQLRDIHALPYYAAIKAGARVVMASYNSWHGSKMHGFAPMLSDVLVKRIFAAAQLSELAQKSRRTQGSTEQPFAGYGLFLLPGDFHKLADFIQQQWQNPAATAALLHSDMLADTLQPHVHNTLATEFANIRYHNSFWAYNLKPILGCEQDNYVPYMMGYGGLALVFLRPDLQFYYVSDGHQYNWRDAAIELNKLADICRINI